MNANQAHVVERPPNGALTAPFAAGSLCCQIYSSFEGLDSLRTAWDDAVLAFNGSVYMTFDWCRIWWQFYGLGKRLCIAVFTHDTRIVAVIPLYFDDLGIRPAQVQVARLVGANIPPKVFNPPVDPAWAGPVFESLLKWLFSSGRCDIVSLGPISSLQTSFDILPQVVASLRHLVGAFSVEEGVHSVFCVPTSMEQYYEDLNKNERKNRRKYELRLLKKEYEVVTDIVREPQAVAAEFERFAPQHTAQWRCQGKPGHFGAWPRALEFNRALVQAQSQLGRARFLRISANGTVICSQYAFALGDAYYWELPARSVGEPWERFSLGPTGIVNMIAAGMQEGVQRIEGGLAHYDYKVRLNAREHTTRTFRLISARARTRISAGLLNFGRLGLLYGYHKIWYRRVVPRLPQRFSRAQWYGWLRLDF